MKLMNSVNTWYRTLNNTRKCGHIHDSNGIRICDLKVRAEQTWKSAITMVGGTENVTAKKKKSKKGNLENTSGPEKLGQGYVRIISN